MSSPIIANPSLCIDFYKVGHKDQYPKGTELVYSNFTPRTSRLKTADGDSVDEVMVFGIYGVLQDLLLFWNMNFFSQEEETVVSYYKEVMDTCLGPDSVDVEHIRALHKLGYLPIRVRALPEGTLCPIKVPVMTIENTLPEFFWITNYLETQLSSQLWIPMTSATIAFEFRKLLENWAYQTGAPLDFVPWQAHDFSARGIALGAGALSGAGHLTSFYGSDSVHAIQWLDQFYFGDDMGPMKFIGGSVPATEHSVMTMGQEEGELELIRRLVTETYPKGIVSVVSDSYDFWRVITEYAKELKEEILARGQDALGNSKVVFRPDSGDPVHILAGYRCYIQLDNTFPDPEVVRKHNCEVVILKGGYEGAPCYLLKESNEYVPISWEEAHGAVYCLDRIFGYTWNDRGYKMLNPKVGLIYGDSITLQRAGEILLRLAEKSYASSNVVFGIGSYTYQYNTRDTLGFAMKATAGIVNGELREIYKDPKTDNGTKKSARGYLFVGVDDNGQYVLEDRVTREKMESSENEMRLLLENGSFLEEELLPVIRSRIGIALHARSKLSYLAG